MNALARAKEMVEPYALEKVANHTLIRRLFGQDQQPLTKSNYAALIIEVFHLIRHTPHYLSNAARHCFEDEWLRDWWMEFAVDESGHDKLCLADLRKMGIPDVVIKRSSPGFGATAMVANNYMVGERNPVALIGFAMATEGLGSSLAGEAAKYIESSYDYGKNSTSFLKVHGAEDVEHYRSVVNAFNKYAGDPGQFDAMVGVWRYTIHNYAQLFDDVLRRGDNWLN